MNQSAHPIISAVVAMAENRVIGKNNQLPWHLPADLKHFKAITTGHPVIMGRKTYLSIGKPLPNRTNIIITRDQTFKAPGCIVTTSIDQAIERASENNIAEIFIIGGAEIYQQLFPRIQRIYITIVHHAFEGDAYFPELNNNAWREINRIKYAADEKNLYDYSFVTLERIKSYRIDA
jgi:dihydrofolate reductase